MLLLLTTMRTIVILFLTPARTASVITTIKKWIRKPERCLQLHLSAGKRIVKVELRFKRKALLG